MILLFLQSGITCKICSSPVIIVLITAIGHDIIIAVQNINTTLDHIRICNIIVLANVIYYYILANNNRRPIKL